MAITGTLETLIRQCNRQQFDKALRHLQTSDLEGLFHQVKEGEPLTIEIGGRDIFAIYQTYETKPLDEAKMEGHKRYIDIQYIHSGTEQILVSPRSRMIKDADYDNEKDLYFPKVADYSSFRLSAGMGCILYPEDLHAPCISIDAPTKVQKIVIKVAILDG